MKINKLIINNLRNHLHSEFDFGDKINLIYGLNGSGKTTILEAISIIALTKSFLPTSDQDLINYNQKLYSLLCEAKTDYNSNYKCKITYQLGSRKQISNTEKDNALPKDIVGLVPIVILSPDYKNITFGTPAERRSFIDRVISQSSKSYLDDIFKLKKVLKQRNSLLSKIKKEEITDKSLLEPWTDQLIDVSTLITIKRNKFINEIRENYKNYYASISNSAEKVDLIYEAYGLDEIDENYEAVREKFNILRKEKSNLELIRGTSGFGPQKDDIRFVIDSGIARENASQGQHKSILISLKLSEFDYLLEKCNEKPIILLDDIFSELDYKRARKVLKIIQENDIQSFITSTDENILDSIPLGSLTKTKIEKPVAS